MKNLLLFIVTFISLGAASQPKRIMLRPQDKQPETSQPEKFYAQSANSYKLSLRIDELQWDKQDVKTGDTYSRLWFKNSLPDGKIGEPELPVVKKLIRIPVGATVSARVRSYTTNEIDLPAKGIQNPIIPVQPSARKDEDTLQIPFQIKHNAYKKALFQNSQPEVTVDVLGTLRNYTIARLTVRPVEYSPMNKKIRVFNNIDVDINIESPATKSNQVPDSYYSPYFDVVYNTMLNAGGTAYDEHPDLTRYPVGMLIVAHRMFETALQPYIEWKTQKGFQVTAKYTDEIGSTADAIKTYIQGVYNAATPDNPAPTFLVIVGDVEQVPASATGSQSGKQTDLYYASVDGDKFPEMYYGRISATSEVQLSAIIDKILYYEKFQFADPSYLNSVNLIAGADGTWNPAVAQPTIKYATANHFNQSKGWANIFEYGVDSDPNNPSVQAGYTGCYNPDKIAVGFINYTAHCSEGGWQDPALPVATVNTFTNQNQYPFVIANCCLSGNFGYSESVGEAWLRKSNGGAVTYIGSSPNSYWKEDMYWATGAFPMSGDNNGYVPTFEESTTGGYDAPFMSSYTTAGAIMFCGNLAVTQAEINDYSRQSNSTYYWEAYNILGDPSLVPYFRVPEPNQIEFPTSVAVGVSTIPVRAKANTYISLTRNGQIVGTKFYPSDELLDISIPVLTEPGKIILTATRPQTQPFIDTIDVFVADNAYLTLSSCTIDDSDGNNNAVADYGETVKVNLFVKNVGKTAATNIGAKITATAGLISLTSTDSIGIGNIDSESEKWVNAAFTFSIPADIDDKYTQVFPVTFTSPEGSWTSNLRLTAAAPKVTYTGYSAIDTLMGNSNGLVDRNELVDLEFEILNNGGSAIPDLSAQVTLPDSLLNFAVINLEPISNRAILPNEKTILNVRLNTSPELQSDTISLLVNFNSLVYPKASKQITVKVPVLLYGVTKMKNGIVKTCGTYFTDSGGETANYSYGENYTITFETLKEYQKYRVEFLAFNTEYNYDFLHAFDGNSTSSGAIAGSPYNGTLLPPTYYTSGNSATFRFISDGNTNRPGWKAKLECVTPRQLPFCAENPKPANNDLNVDYTQLSWDASSDALYYDVYIGKHPDSLAYYTRVPAANVTIPLLPQTSYYWRVIPGNQFGTCDKSCEIWSFRTASVVGQVLMTNATVTVDSLWFYDSGGSSANYGNKENYTITFKPKVSSQKVKVEFSLFDVESHSTCSYDRLIVFDGPTTQSAQLGTFCGSNIPPVFTSSSSGGELTFQFISDVNTVGHGWIAKVTTTGSVSNYPVTVNVTDNGNPIPNASVVLNNAIKFTSNQGSVTYSIPNGTYDYTISALGFEPATGSIVVSSEAKTLNVDLVKQQTIQLKVLSAYDLSPLTLAKIEINGKKYYTASNGISTINVPVGNQAVNISADGFYAKDTIIVVNPGMSIQNIILEPVNHNIQFVVSDINGNRLSNARISAGTLQEQTNNEGLVSFSLIKGTSKVVVQKDGFINTEFWLNVNSDSTINIYMNQIRGNVCNIRFTINGSGPKGSTPLNGASVKVYSGTDLYLQGKSTYGSLNLYLPNGTFAYIAECEGYISSPMVEFNVNNLPLELTETLNQLTFSLTFLVSSKGNPVANAKITIDGYPEQQTGTDGMATFSTIGYEKGLQYTVSHPEYYTLVQTVDAVKSETVSVNLTPLSAETTHTEPNISVFPNPASSFFRIEASEPIDNVSIFSINGTLLHRVQLNSTNQTISINLPTGLYLVKVSMSNGSSHFKKLIVH